MQVFGFEDGQGSEVENMRTIKYSIGNVVTQVMSFALLGFETIWRILCSTQYEDVLKQGEIFLASIYLKLNVKHLNDQLIYETFFEKVFLMLELDHNSSSNCLHILLTFLDIYRDFITKLNQAPNDQSKKSQAERLKKGRSVYVKTMFRRLDPAEVLMSVVHYLDKITSLLLYPEYETVEQAIALIKSLPILNHEKSAVFICAFLDSSQEANETAAKEFKESMGFTIEDHQYVYFWLQFMKLFFKQISEDEQIKFLEKFERFDEFNISIILRYLKELATMEETEIYRIPLLLNISTTLMNFIAKLQQHYPTKLLLDFEEIKEADLEVLNEDTKPENQPKQKKPSDEPIPDIDKLLEEKPTVHQTTSEEQTTNTTQNLEDFFDFAPAEESTPKEKKPEDADLLDLGSDKDNTEEPIEEVIDTGNDDSNKDSKHEANFESEKKKNKGSPYADNVEFHMELATNLLNAVSNLVLEFRKIDKVKDYLVKTSFVEKVFVFISNRTERFPQLMKVLYDCDTLKLLFKHLFFNGQRFRGHKICCNFVEHLCTVITQEQISTHKIKPPCDFFIHFFVTELFEHLTKNTKYSLNDISHSFFSIIIKMYKMDLYRVLEYNSRIQGVCEDLKMNIQVIKNELFRGIKHAEKSSALLESCKKFLKDISLELINRNETLEDAFDSLSKEYDLTQFVQNCVDNIYGRDTLSEEHTDHSLVGMLRILEIILIKFPTIIDKPSREKLLAFLFHECLYKMENGVLCDTPLYKNPKVRKTTMELCLSMLYQKYQNEQSIFIDLTYNILRSMKWRNTTKKSWYCHYNTAAQIASKNKKKGTVSKINKKAAVAKRTTFVGLNNLTNTCYMNSIFQQLFMIPCFRALIMKADNPKENEVLYQSKLMLAALMKLDKQSFTPK